MTLYRRDLLRSVLLAACACGLERFAYAQAPNKEQAVPSLEKWKISDPPRFPNPDWYAANGSSLEWQVFLQNGRVCVQRDDTLKPEQTRLPFLVRRKWLMDEPKAAPGNSLHDKDAIVKVSDGWLLFTNAGEWGGRIDWFSPNGTRHYKVSNDQVCAFRQTPEGLLAIQGLAHMSLSIGTFLRFEQNAIGRWETKTLIDLQDTPYVLLPEGKGTFLIVTSGKLLRIHSADRTVTPLVEKAFWGSMYPNSLVAALNGNFYIGMRGGVARVEKTNAAYKVRWLTPPARHKQNA